MYSLRLFCKFVKYRFLAQIEYPGSYIAGILAQWFVYGVETFMLFLMIWNFGALAGWLPAEIIFMYAVWLLSYAIGASFVFNICMSLPQMAVEGTFDEALIRPVSPFVYLLSTTYNLGYVSHITLMTAAIVWSIRQLGLVWTAWQWVWLAAMVIAGAVIQGCMMLLCEMPSFRTRSKSPAGMLFWEVRGFMRYPVTIYPRPVQFVFAIVLPYGFISFYPIQVLLGKQDGLFAEVAMWLAPAAAVLLLGVTSLCWRGVSRGYESAGT
jgi:ABC-2 type transport system permease protein